MSQRREKRLRQIERRMNELEHGVMSELRYWRSRALEAEDPVDAIWAQSPADEYEDATTDTAPRSLRERISSIFGKHL